MNFVNTFLLLCLAGLITGCTQTTPTPQITINNPAQSSFAIDIANTPETRKTGLMFVEKLTTNKGMYFIFDQPKTRNFWMKNTLIPLDIIFANNNTIISIQENVPPCQADPCPTYPSTAPANQVLEINAGLSQKLNIKPGQTWTLSKP
ncbi:hypothetical protein COV81_03665 [Candidatus Peregrinibacteria bacterium CG11_big_fil_rev_8_21_14_0_20_41_10]|nr:MAG: hypothetical protein COV81_03665 [Candidatus Peregrinibacteria bacterium CG11_big_fil_rev_8_21_14_0_20_41_10]